MLIKLCNRKREILALWQLPQRVGRAPRAPGEPLDVPELVAWDVLGYPDKRRYFRVDIDSIRVDIIAKREQGERIEPITPVYIECEAPTILGGLGE